VLARDHRPMRVSEHAVDVDVEAGLGEERFERAALAARRDEGLDGVG
jgi:uncharacterized protein (UPF0548 family)